MITIKALNLIVAGLGFGDEGKGTITDFLTRKYSANTVIRYNGGSQAAHNVVTTDGRHHCFSQFGSGTLSPGTRTFLSGHTIVDPLAIMLEAEMLEKIDIKDALKRLDISGQCLVVTPLHKHLNRMLEISRGDKRHGSCGKGIGQTVTDGQTLGQLALRAVDLPEYETTRYKLDFLWRCKLDQAEQLLAEQPGNGQLRACLNQLKRPNYAMLLARVYRHFSWDTGVNIVPENHLHDCRADYRAMIFEGAQGVLLDADYGFWPHVTRTDTTFNNADKLLHGSAVRMTTLGVLRAYATRHGAGPFPSEDAWLTKQLPDKHNRKDKWQGAFRVGWPDLLATRYALKVCGGVDSLAITNLDRLYDLGQIKVCVAYRYQSKDRFDLDRFFDWEKIGGAIIIRNIKLVQPPDQEHQSRLTQHLLRCEPIYLDLQPLHRPGGNKQSLPAEAKKYLSYLETALNTPISIVSVGPTATDKIKLKPCV